jgi:hypothetical protein
MTKFENMFHLTRAEARAIYRWLRQKRYDSSKDSLKIIFEPLYGHIYVSSAITQGNETEWLDLDEYSEQSEQVAKDVDKLFLGEYIFELEINEANYAPFLPILDKSVEAQVNDDIEPVICFVFIINQGVCEVYVAGTRLGSHHLLKIKIGQDSFARKHFKELTELENYILCKDLKAEWPEKDIPYFNDNDMAILIERLDLYGYEVYGIECWTGLDKVYFETYVQEYYPDRYNIPKDGWFVDAHSRMLKEYTEIVLSEDPKNPPIFNVSVGR